MSDAGDELGLLDELAEARLAEGRRLLAGLVLEHAALAAAARAEMEQAERDEDGDAVEGPAVGVYHDFGEEDWAAGLPVEQARCLMFALAEWLSAGGQAYSWRGGCFYWLTHRPLDLAAGDVRLLAALAEPGDESAGYRPFEFVVQAVEELVGQQAVGSRALAEAVADQVLGGNAMVYHGGCADPVLRADLGGWDCRHRVGKLRDRALEVAGRPRKTGLTLHAAGVTSARGNPIRAQGPKRHVRADCR